MDAALGHHPNIEPIILINHRTNMSDVLDCSSQPGDCSETSEQDSMAQTSTAQNLMAHKEEEDPFLKGKKYQKRKRTQSNSVAYDDFVACLEEKWKQEKEAREQREKARVEREVKRKVKREEREANREEREAQHEAQRERHNEEIRNLLAMGIEAIRDGFKSLSNSNSNS